MTGRNHWLSDTVAGAALGYALGDHCYRGSPAATDPATGPRLWITPRAVVVQWPLQ